MKKFYKNIIDFKSIPDPEERRRNISKEIIRHEDYMPKTLTYEDIDRSFKEWVEKNIELIQDGKKLPTMVLYSNQRFSEYMQTWQYTDENNNIRLNFKTVTRENNPSHGTIVGDTYNIPGQRYYTFKTIDAIDESGKEYKIMYKMKQPTAVDLNYKVSVLTNKYITLNEFNERIQQLFNAKQSYICPNGHYMSLTLENISDETEYNIQDRQFFSQTFITKVRGYIIKENDLIVEEVPIHTSICFFGDEGKRKKPSIDVYDENICYNPKEELWETETTVEIENISFCSPNKGKIKFTWSTENEEYDNSWFVLSGIEFNENNIIVENDIKLFINDKLISENLLSDAWRGYKKLENKPIDSNNENTLLIENDFLPNEQNIKYKYLLFNNEYYIWYQIKFNEEDEITIQTKKQQNHRYDKVSSLILKGYTQYKKIIM